jgi:hypothetical protein
VRNPGTTEITVGSFGQNGRISHPEQHLNILHEVEKIRGKLE